MLHRQFDPTVVVEYFFEDIHLEKGLNLRLPLRSRIPSEYDPSPEVSDFNPLSAVRASNNPIVPRGAGQIKETSRTNIVVATCVGQILRSPRIAMVLLFELLRNTYRFLKRLGRIGTLDSLLL